MGTAVPVTPDSDTAVPVAGDNITPLTPEALGAIQQQRQQFAQQLNQDLSAASPDSKVALIAAFRAQMDTVVAPLQPPVLTDAQQAAQSAQQQAAQQAFAQSLSADAQAAVAAMQQRQQLLGQLTTASPDDKLAIIAQVRQLAAQQEQATAAQAPPVDGPAATAAAAQAQAALQASLPPREQAVMQAMNQRQQAIQAASQLPPDQRAAALQAIQAQALPGLAVSATDPVAADLAPGTSTAPSASPDPSQNQPAIQP